MIRTKRQRTVYEDRLELKMIERYLLVGEFKEIHTPATFSNVRARGRNLLTVKTLYNNIQKTHYLIGNKVRFREPESLEYEVMLKGDMFLLFNRSAGLYRVFNTLDDTILEEKEVSSINLRVEAERLTKEIQDKILIY